METTAVRDGDDWVINGTKRFNTGLHVATHDLVFARTSGKPGDARGITASWCRPRRRLQGRVHVVDVQHADRPRRGVARPTSRCRRRPSSARRAEGLDVAQTLRAREPHPPGRLERSARRSTASTRRSPTPSSARCSASRWRRTRRSSSRWPSCRPRPRWCATLVHKTAWQLDRQHHMEVSDKVSMSQLPRQSPGLRGRRPRDPGPRRHRLLAPQAVRAHLSPPPPLPHHRGLGGDPDPPRRRRLFGFWGAQKASTAPE